MKLECDDACGKWKMEEKSGRRRGPSQKRRKKLILTVLNSRTSEFRRKHQASKQHVMSSKEEPLVPAAAAAFVFPPLPEVPSPDVRPRSHSLMYHDFDSGPGSIQSPGIPF